MFVVGRLSPKRMLQLSTFGCLVAAVVTAAAADKFVTLFYASALVFGFAVSWQFGAAYSWVSEHLDVVVSWFVCIDEIYTSSEKLLSSVLHILI